MIYCGIHEADHTAAEFAECLKGTEPAPSVNEAVNEDGE